MKHSNCVYLFLIFVIALSGCASNETTLTPTWTQAQLPSPTLILSTSTPTFLPTQMPTLTPPATLEPEQAKDTMRTLLRGPLDCGAPCFWGIMPGQTTLGEAKSIFTHLGIQIRSTTYEGKDFYGIRYDFDSGISIIVTLTVQEEIVENLRVDITPEIQRAGIPREWLAYSPETLINRYGLPSRVDFSVDRGPHEPGTTYTDYFMIMYFDKVNMIVSYEYGSIDPQLDSLRVCPLTDQFTLVRVWLGANPQHPPLNEIPLEQAMSVTMEEFSNLMTGHPNKACFNLKEEAFPP
jgi:hypothetical protein